VSDGEGSGSEALEVAMDMHIRFARSWWYHALALGAISLLLGGCGGGTFFALKDANYPVIFSLG
jgi:hypothetical protein